MGELLATLGYLGITINLGFSSKRIEEIGYDRKGRSYYVLDDNRLYRRTDPPLPPPKPVKPKANRKSARAMRASKRRKLSGAVAFDEDSDEENNSDVNGDDTIAEKYTGEYEWECIAITLAEYQQFADSIRNTKDADEKVLRNVLRERVIPFMEKIEEEQQRKRAKREKELVNLQLLAGAKRSSRIAQKAERERQEREASEAARKRETDLLIAHKEQEKQKRMEEERRSRVMTREQRMRDREQKRLLHEAELERIAEEQKKLERGESRMSERHLQAEMERQKKSLEELTNEDHWFFDCSGCGVHGENLDDGSHSVACEKCNVWQHSKCLGIAQEEAEREDFHFVCNDCKRREEEAKFPKLPKLRFRIGASSSPPPSHTAAVNGVVESFHEHATAPSPVKREKAYEAPPNLTDSQPILPPPSTSHTVSYPSPSSSHPMSARQSTSPRTLHSPSKGTNGFARSVERLPKLIPNQYSLPPSQQTGHNGSFTSQRPSSSHSVRSTNLPSPIQNRPSMSPTQGNRDVGPLVGFPSAAVPNDSTPWTPFAARGDTATTFPSSSSVQNGYPSFSAATPGGAASFGHPRSTSPSQSSQGIPSSGISPTKQSPRPVASGSLVGAPVVPPIQKLEPSPKLMGRSSPDAPIPPPVKSMSLDQEGRRQREHALLQARTTGSPLGPSAVGQQELLQQQPYSLSSSSVQRDKDVNGQ